MGEVKRVNQPRSTDIQQILQEQDFVPLPTGVDGTQLTVRKYDIQDVVCCDFLVYRELQGKGETLSNEVPLLIQAISQLQTQLQSPTLHLNPKTQSQTITFLGKKAYILTDESGHLLECRIYPLFISHSSTNPEVFQDSTSVFAPPIIQVNQLATYLTQNIIQSDTKLHPLEGTFRPLQRAYQYLSLALICFPFLLGLSGILWGLGLVLLGIPIMLCGLFAPILLLRKALNAFHRFRLQHSIKVTLLKSPSTVSAPPEVIGIQGQPAELSQLNVNDELVTTNTAWTATTTAAYLQDTIHAAMTASLNTYQAGNWRGFSEHARAFLINGLRMGVLKQSGEAPPDNLTSLLNQIDSDETRQSLAAWLQRLAIARQQRPLLPSEAQQLMNYAVHILRQQHAIPPTWEIQVFQVIPRVNNLISLPITQPKLPTPNSLVFDQEMNREPSRTIPIQPRQIIPTDTPSTPTTLDQGVPLRVESKNDLRLLSDLIRSGASPYLLVFANRYVTSWSTLLTHVNQVAQQLGSKLNVILFPGLGDSERTPEIMEYYQLFRVEGSTEPPSLPFICLLSRQLLMHIVEDAFPVPTDLIIKYRIKGFLDQVESLIKTAQTYQIDPEALEPASPQGVINQKTESVSDKNKTEPAKVSESGSLPSSVVAEIDDVIEEVITAPLNTATQRVMEVDLSVAQERRVLARMQLIALAVVRLPRDQFILDALETAAAEEPYLIAQYIDSENHPTASKVLKLPPGSVKLCFNGTERLLTKPKAEHLIANIHQLRAMDVLPTLDGQSQNQFLDDTLPQPRRRRKTKSQKIQQRG